MRLILLAWRALDMIQVEKRDALIRGLTSAVAESARRHEDCRREWSGNPDAGKWLQRHSTYLEWRSGGNGLLRMTGEREHVKTLLRATIPYATR